jgi:hypothetical protein
MIVKPNIKDPISEKKEIKNDFDTKIVNDRLPGGIRKIPQKQEGLQRHKKHPTIKIFLSVSLIIIFSLFCGMIAVILFVGPVIQKESALPSDFPSSLTIYQADQATIKSQDADKRQKLLQTLNSLPNWFLTPFLAKFSTDLKTQILIHGQPVEKYDSLALKIALDLVTDKAKTVSLKWKNISKTKEDLSEYYLDKFQKSGYLIKKTETSTGIITLFQKESTKGILYLTDSFSAKDSSNLTITVIY